LQVPNAVDKIIETEIEGEKVIVIRDSSKTGEKGFDIFAPRKVYQQVFDELKTQGAIEISDETREVLRVEAGKPKFGVDFDETNVVLESGLDEAVSFTKGCYIGQEIIARIHFRGHVAKQLGGLTLDENADVKIGDELKSIEGKNAGKITSVTFSPKLDKIIALAIIRYEFLAPETQLLIGVNQVKANVVKLPFVK
ncbi:MAG: aminomethyl transferase family protein, partial [Pyrinomonadaceae bacterium]|nr:aminomethyl transferase family protein [Pyrinomonadaceae bacterium]